jgi:curli production assembly/transport component CsgG
MMKYLILPLMIAGCVSTTAVQEDPELVMPTHTYEVPAPKDGKVVVGVYGFADLTGQRTGTTLSSAVTQGAENYLITGLKDFDNGNWFRVVDRKSIDNLIKERQIIKSANPTFTDEDMPAMLYAGVLIEGGIVGYDTNVVSGGDGVRIFGLGTSGKYSKHVVTISLRAVSVATTEVLASVLVQKTIVSKSENLTVVAFFDQDTQTIEMESGSNYNEPSNYAVQSAIEKGIYELVIEGKRQKIW